MINTINDIKKNIQQSGISIYDAIDKNKKELFYSTEQLEYMLNEFLVNLSLESMPLRTRSKIVKQKVCEALGYPIPKSFKKTQPRFIGQNFDTYIQKSNNLQIWNEEVISTRRYVIIKVSSNNIIEKVKVITGETLALYDKTGTLTQKYQATVKPSDNKFELISVKDTPSILSFINDSSIAIKQFKNKPIDYPDEKSLLPIKEIFERLKPLVGKRFPDTGSDQERNRGAVLQKLVCNALGYKIYSDKGQFPDIVHQLLEVKLQSSPTIDLGLVSPTSRCPLSIPPIKKISVKHSDVRYLIFYCDIRNEIIILTHLILVTGQDFFTRFPRFEGKVINKKLQIPLPNIFFD